MQYKLSQLLTIIIILKEIKIKAEEYIQKQYKKNKLYPLGIEASQTINNYILCVLVQYTTKQ